MIIINRNLVLYALKGKKYSARLIMGLLALLGAQIALAASAHAQTVPSAPQYVSALAADGEGDIYFSPPLDNGGSPITSYTVTAISNAKINGVNVPTNLQVTGNSSPLHITGLANSTASVAVNYVFSVTATNALGTSPEARSCSIYMEAGVGTGVAGTSWGFRNLIANGSGSGKVLLIGDSISNQYGKFVASALSSKAARVDIYSTPVTVAAGNCFSQPIQALILKNGPYQVIHFNDAGLHFHTWEPRLLAAYEQSFAQFVENLKAVSGNAQLVYATTTPARVGDKFPENTQLDNTVGTGRNWGVTSINQKAVNVLRDKNIPVNDLYSLMEANLAKSTATDVFHYQQAGVNLLAIQVAKYVDLALKSASTYMPTPTFLYRFDNPSNALSDSSGNNLGVTVTGNQQIVMDSSRSRVLNFNGLSQSYFDIPINETASTSWTRAVWVKLANNKNRLAIWRSVQPANETNEWMAIYPNSNNKANMVLGEAAQVIYNDGSSFPIDGVNSPNFPLNAWTHIAVVYNGVSHRYSIFRDGNFVGATGQVTGGTGYKLRIGFMNTFVQGFNGRMDDLVQYPYALNSNQVGQLYLGNYGTR